jgi:hypothetical protein
MLLGWLGGGCRRIAGIRMRAVMRGLSRYNLLGAALRQAGNHREAVHNDNHQDCQWYQCVLAIVVRVLRHRT